MRITYRAADITRVWKRGLTEVDMAMNDVAERAAKETIPSERTLLIVEDDRSFLQRLAKALEQRGFTVATAEIGRRGPGAGRAGGAGLRGGRHAARRRQRARRDFRAQAPPPGARAIILTGYGNIATAVNAVKLGAVDYLAKPADADDVVAALARARRQEDRAAGKSDVGRPRALGAHPAHLRIVRPQRLGDRAPAQHAPPHPAAHSGQTRAALSAAHSDRFP